MMRFFQLGAVFVLDVLVSPQLLPFTAFHKEEKPPIVAPRPSASLRAFYTLLTQESVTECSPEELKTIRTELMAFKPEEVGRLAVAVGELRLGPGAQLIPPQLIGLQQQFHVSATTVETVFRVTKRIRFTDELLP